MHWFWFKVDLKVLEPSHSSSQFCALVLIPTLSSLFLSQFLHLGKVQVRKRKACGGRSIGPLYHKRSVCWVQHITIYYTQWKEELDIFRAFFLGGGLKIMPSRTDRDFYWHGLANMYCFLDQLICQPILLF